MNRSATLRVLPLAAMIGLLCSATASASTYVYGGRLDDGGRPADGRYDLSLTPYPAEKQGATLAAPMVFEDVEVRGGQFRLEFDLPAMNAEHTWLELGVRDGAAAGDFAAIPGRAKAIAAPLVGACWSTTGDTGVNPATNFLGTIDNQPLAFRVNNARAWQASFFNAGTFGTSVNIVGGSASNSATGTFTGQTVAGGGNATLSNRADAHYATVGGGRGNLASQTNATVAGGERNSATGEHSAVAGGLANSAAGPWSAVSGGDQNCAGGAFSWAGGRFAKVRRGDFSGPALLGCANVPSTGDGDGDAGSFVWSDSQDGVFQTTGDNQFLVRAGGGVGINTNMPAVGSALTVNGNVSTSGALNFGAQTRQMINLWGPTPTNSFYGIGVQTATQYFRTDATGSFAWFTGGSHANGQGDPGTGGNRVMDLDGRGLLTVQNAASNAGTLSGPGLRLAFADPTGPLSFTRWDIFASRSTFNAIPPGALYFGYGNVIAAVFDTNGLTRNQSGTWSTISDARLKKNIRDIESPLDTYLKLRGHWFEYTDPKAAMSRPGPRMGFVAQEVQAAVPEWISSDPDGYLSVTPTGFEALTVEAVRQLHEENAVVDDDQARRIATLEAENAALRAELEHRDAAFQSRLEALEARLEQRR